MADPHFPFVMSGALERYEALRKELKAYLNKPMEATEEGYQELTLRLSLAISDITSSELGTISKEIESGLSSVSNEFWGTGSFTTTAEPFLGGSLRRSFGSTLKREP